MTKTKTLGAQDFVHLHNHTHHSLLDGLQKVPEMLDRVKELGMEAVAITDHGTLSGTIEFYKGAKERGIKPIIGIETYVAARRRTDKDPAKDKARYHLILLAMDQQGYENLMRLSTKANLEGFYHKPRIDHELLEQYNQGLIALSGCIGGEVGEALRAGQDNQAREIIRWYKSVFGDRYYLEVQDHGHQWDEQRQVNNKILALSQELDVPAVLTSDAHYLRHDDQEAHEILLCVQTGAFFEDQDRMSLTETDLYVADPSELIERWGDTPELLSNTRVIADRCNVDIPLGQILIPQFPVPKGQTDTSFLHTMVYQGLAWRYGGKERGAAQKLSEAEAAKTFSKEIKERAEYELETINKMGFASYFLIVQDFINWGKDRGIVFGPGRGSAAGSIVSYALNITDLDPLAYDLLFERFLNPDRISMPDIDIDIQDSRRDEVIRYCVEKYGEDRVAHIVTFGTMAARAAVRDVARVLKVPYAEADRLAKLIPPPVQGRHIPLATSVVKDQQLKSEYESSPTAKRVIDLAIRLEGTIRSHGVHAAGVVIARDELVKFAPLEMAQKGVVTTQYPMGPIEDLGLLKMDFLGLSNLTIIKNALRIVKRVYGNEIDVGAIPLDDKRTFELLGRGDTTGVFQLESAGMKRYIKQLQPTRFEDIIAMVALYRPGPMQFIDDFIARKHGRREISFFHEKMKDALENTYGILVYQEQVMQIAKDMCGFTGGQADTLRKGVAKKKPEVLATLKKDFIEGAIKTSSVEKGIVEQFWQQLEAFAAYCFPKAHASCYATIAYWTAYLKAHYPDAFMAALMTSDFDDTDRLAIEISECRHMGIEVLPPDVNESFLEFGVVPDKSQVRFGLAAVKNVGTGAAEEILRAREAAGPFESLEAFAERVSCRVVNRKAWESLVKAGAFDSFADRGTLLYNLDTILAYAAKRQKEAESGQTDLFGGILESAVVSALQLEQPPAETPEREALQWERELLGLYLSRHPLDSYDTYFQENVMPIEKVTTELDGSQVTVGGVIVTVRQITTKSGSPMAFVQLADKSGELEVIVFPDAYAKSPDLWKPDRVLAVTGVVNCKDRDGRDTDEIKVLVDSVVEISEETAKSYQPTGKQPDAPKTIKKRRRTNTSLMRLYVHIKEPDDSSRLLQLKRLLNDFPGDTEAILVLGTARKNAIKLPFRVAATNELQQAISHLYSPECVIVK